jgi:carbamoyl-phosphate synthase large subunit
MKELPRIGLPAIIRPSFTLGGSGGGIANTEEEYKAIVHSGLDASPTSEVLIDESILGWKEYEMEVVRDKADNAIIICSIENIDPMGVHTGDSITVAPALTLTDKEYQIMRDASLAVLREIGVETGGSNVQFAVNPENGKLIVIEMNPRVSRSSALASKATGFPIAKVAAKLAVGYTLDEIQNDITEVTPASFEPTIDYVVTKIPRFTFEKFGIKNPQLSSAMRSVGEAMSIGRSFTESLQKGLRSMETGLTGLNSPIIPGVDTSNSKEANQAAIREALTILAPDRLLRIAEALRYDISQEEICKITHFDPWFVEQIARIVEAEEKIKENGLPSSKKDLLPLKKLGFSDARLGELTGKTSDEVAALRHELDVRPVYKTVDTCAAEFESHTPYMYSCYEGNHLNPAECESNPSDNKKIIILGGGPNRIGQGIEFDYACVHAAFSLSDSGYETIMVNCNPETVSTDYDTSDRLYFEPLTGEDVVELIKREQENGEVVGVIVQFGGQTPLKLSKHLEEAGIPIIGTSPDKIDLAEDRKRFQQLLHDLDLKQPKNTTCFKVSDIKDAVKSIGYPCVIRPSNVLGGRAMEIIYNDKRLDKYLEDNGRVLLDGPILIDKFLDNATEIDVDALSDGDDVYVSGIMEHIEEAGIHSGDSACVLPPHSLSDSMIEEIKESTVKLARALNVVGLMNVQYAVRGEELFVIEVNPRASRTVPFVAKATGVSIAKIGAQLMAGRKLSEFDIQPPKHDYYAVKESVFPFGRFADVDIVLGPEMKSTGEVIGLAPELDIAFAKAQIGAGNHIPKKGNILFSVQDSDKAASLELAKQLLECGYTICATSGTASYFKENGLTETTVANKVYEGGHHVVEMIENKEIRMVINTNVDAQAMERSYTLRRSAYMNKLPYATTMAGAKAIVKAIRKLLENKEFSVEALQDVA